MTRVRADRGRLAGALMLAGLAGCAEEGAQVPPRIDAAHWARPAYPIEAKRQGLVGAAVGFCDIDADGGTRCRLAYSSNPIFTASATGSFAVLRFLPGTPRTHYRVTLRFAPRHATPHGVAPPHLADADTLVVPVASGVTMQTVRYDCLIGLDALVHDCRELSASDPLAIAPARIALARVPFVPDMAGEQAIASRRRITVRLVPPGIDPDNPFE